MKKNIRFALIAFSILVFVFVAVAIAIPLLYKEDIQALVKKNIDENVNAKVLYDPQDFHLTILSSFPDIGLELQELTVIGQEPFAKDTLLSVQEFALEIDLWDFVIHQEITLHDIYIKQPIIKLISLDSLTHNYDIMRKDPSENQVVENQGQTQSNLPTIFLDSWIIEDGQIEYVDSVHKRYVKLWNIDKQSGGYLSPIVSKVVTNLSVGRMAVGLDTVKYILDQPVQIGISGNIQGQGEIISVKEAQIQIGELALSSKGFLEKKDNRRYNVAVELSTKNVTLESLISIVPKAFKQALEGYEAQGQLEFRSAVNGIWDIKADTYPAMIAMLNLKEGKLVGKDLKNQSIAVDAKMTAENLEGKKDISLEIQTLSLALGKSVAMVQGKAEHLPKGKVLIEAKAQLNLKDLMPFVADTLLQELRGNCKMNIALKGLYDSDKNIMPDLVGNMTVSDGLLRSPKYNQPVNVNMGGNFSMRNGQLSSGKLYLDSLNIVQDQQRFKIKGEITNFKKQLFALGINGAMDLSILQPFLPQQSKMNLQGTLKTYMNTSGNASELQNKNFENLIFNGDLNLTNFLFYSLEYPQHIQIKEAKLKMTKAKINLFDAQMLLGKSDVTASGSLSNYFNYVLADETLFANLKISSGRFFTDEWITEEEVTKPSSNSNPKTPASQTAVKIPRNIKLVSQIQVGELLYSSFRFKNFKGNMIVEDGILRFENMNTSFLGGLFAGDFSLDTKPNLPKYDSSLEIVDVSLSDAFEKTSFIQKLLPIARGAEGSFSAQTQFSGLLTHDFDPLFNTLNGRGNLETSKVKLENVKALRLVSDLSGIKNLSSPRIKDTQINFNIQNGNMELSPFSTAIAQIPITVYGNSSVDGQLDLKMDMQVPSQGGGLMGLIGQFTKSKNLNLSFDITGPSSDPKVKIVSPRKKR